jgi:hypothetical protein
MLQVCVVYRVRIKGILRKKMLIFIIYTNNPLLDITPRLIQDAQFDLTSTFAAHGQDTSYFSEII